MLLTIVLALGLIVADQIIKQLIAFFVQPVGVMEVIPGFIRFNYVENTGAAFSMLSGMRVVLIIVTAVVLAGVAYILIARRPKGALRYLGLVFIFAGGVGNLIDRIANGYVVDYLEFEFVRFAIFNFADILVTFGFVMLILSFIIEEYKNYKAKKAGGTEKIDERPHGAD